MKITFRVLLLITVFFSCKEKTVKQSEHNKAAAYTLVSDWPVLLSGFKLGQPTGIGIDTSNHIFVFHRAGRRWTEPFPDSTIAENTILELDSETGKIIRSWGAGYFIMPHGLTVDKSNHIWVTDVGLHQVFKFSHDGVLLLKLGIAKVPGNDSLHFNLPTDVAVDTDGSVYVSDGYGNSRIVKFSKSGAFIKAWGTFGNKAGEFNIPHGLAIDADNILYVADRQNNRVQLFDTSGRFIKELKNDVAVEQLPSVAISNAGQLFAVDYDPSSGKDSAAKGSTVFLFDSSHSVTNHFGATGSNERITCWFHDLAIDSKGNLYVSDITGLKLLKFKQKSTD